MFLIFPIPPFLGFPFLILRDDEIFQQADLWGTGVLA